MMTMLSNEILEIFHKLRESVDGKSDLIGETLDSTHGIYVACTIDKELVLILRDQITERVPSRDLSALTVDYGVTCRALVSGREILEEAILIKLKVGNYELEPAFALFVSMALIEIAALPNEYEPKNLVRNLLTLFQSKPKDSRESVIGFYGELSLIARSANPEAWAVAWHSNPLASKDFTFTNVHVEVKTTESRSRRHKLNIDQFHGGGKPVMLASIQVEEVSTGKTVIEVIQEMENLISRDSYRKVCNLFFETLGISNAVASDLPLEVVGGTEGILVLDSKGVPSPRLPDDAIDSETIVSVDFVSNFDLVIARNSTLEKNLWGQSFRLFEENWELNANY